MDIERFTKNPALLADLCREVVARIDVAQPALQETSESVAMEAQLREIAKTVDRLEKINVPVPDVLRAEKTRLAAALGVQDEVTRALEQVADSLGVVLREIRGKLQRRKPQLATPNGTVERTSADRLSRTAMRNAILSALRTSGGSAPKAQVLELVAAEFHGLFLTADLAWLDGQKCFSWQNSARKVRDQLVREGAMKSDSKLGIWELNEGHS